MISNNQGRLIRRLLADLALDAHLGAVLGEEDMPLPKPDPRGLGLAAQRLGVPLARCVYVGDTPGDLHTAQAAGIPCIGVGWGITARETLAQHGFSAVVTTPGELLAAVMVGR